MLVHSNNNPRNNEVVRKLKLLPRVRPSHGRGSKWTLEEHEQFIELIKKHEKNWRDHAIDMVPSKTFKQIRGHYEQFYRKALNSRDHPIAPLLINNFHVITRANIR